MRSKNIRSKTFTCMAEGSSRSPRIVILWTTDESEVAQKLIKKKVISDPVVETTGKTHNLRMLF